MSFPLRYAAVLLPFALAACSTAPTGPNIMVLPGTGKTLAEFQADDYACREFSSAQIGAPQTDATGRTTVPAKNADLENTPYYELQVRYDNAYQQCMFSKGHKIPVVVNFAEKDANGNLSTSSNTGAAKMPPNSQKAPPAKYIVK